MDLRRLFRRARPEAGPTLADDGSLVVVGSSYDPARADSAVVAEMEAAGVDLSEPLLLRHHLRLPDGLAAEEARRIVAQEGYVLLVADGGAGADGAVADGVDGTGADDRGGLRVRVSRPQLVTGLVIAQERSRMAGLAQKLGGDVDGWDVLAAR
jgi:hypothetical protein